MTGRKRRRIPFTCDTAWNKVTGTARKPHILLNKLPKKEQKRVEDANDILENEQEKKKRKNYRVFLYKLFDYSHPNRWIAIISISVGQEVTEMNQNEQRSLLDKIGENQDFVVNITKLEEIAIRFKIPSSKEDLQDIVSKIPQHVATSVIDQQQENELVGRSEISSIGSTFTTYEQKVFQNALLRGIVNVFDEWICDAIRRVNDDGILKASVTMVFPVWAESVYGGVQCVMSLDVCGQDVVERLAMALFGAKVQWREQSLHITYRGGMTAMASNPEDFTLKGVLDGGILEAFGSEIDSAASECPLRKRELVEGKQVSECGSMTLTKNGAIVNLSLDLEGGQFIQDKLYT